jgi:hypothetical protein
MNIETHSSKAALSGIQWVVGLFHDETIVFSEAAVSTGGRSQQSGDFR